MALTWKKVKERGSEHYKIDPRRIEPIDLYRSGGMLQDFIIGNIIKYAYRNRRARGNPINPKDLDKIRHYTDMLEVLQNEQPRRSLQGKNNRQQK